MASDKRKREDYVVFPSAILGFFSKDDILDIGVIVFCIMRYAQITNQLSSQRNKNSIDYLLNESEDWANNHKRLGFDPERVFCELQKLANDTKQPITSIAIETLAQFYNKYLLGENDDDDARGLIAYLAIKSIIGKDAYAQISWSVLIPRMCGLRGGVYSKLSQQLKDKCFWASGYLGKRGKEKMLKKLKGWGVSYIPNGKGFNIPFFSYKMDETALINALEKKGYQVFTMKDVRHKDDIPF